MTSSPVARTSATRHVVINEVAWMGTDANANHEWIELYNTTQGDIDLNGWTLSDYNGMLATLTGTIPAGGFYLLARYTTVFTNAEPRIDQLLSGSLRNDGEAITLTDYYGALADTANMDRGYDQGWAAGISVIPRRTMERIDPLANDTDSNWGENDGVTRNGRDAGDNPINGTPKQPNSTTLYSSPKHVLISAVHNHGYDGVNDEAVQLTNAGTETVFLLNWRLTEGNSDGVTLPAIHLAPGQRGVWVARNATSFYTSFGHLPDMAVVTAGTALPLEGTWPGLTNDGGDVRLFDGSDRLQDRMLYGSAMVTGTGWQSATVLPYTPTNSFAQAGQILYRKMDETTGLPDDTDTAADWAQDLADPTSGRRVMYPGWDMDLFFWPCTSTTPATITLGVAPDNAFDVVSQAIRSAQRSIEIEAYELENYGVITEIVQKASSVSVTVLLEGEGVEDQERWACQEIEAARGQCWFMHNNSDDDIHDRYSLIHAKFIIIDRERLVVSTQNMSSSGMPDDDKSDGTYGSRGYLLYIESRELAGRAGQIFDHDLDPARHNDIARWGTFGFVMPITEVAPITLTGGTTSAVILPSPQVVTDATHFELFTAPEAALRQSDALLGLLAQAQVGDAVYVEQMYEYPDWSGAPNLRLEGYIAAARRGALVRILLNSGVFDQDYIDLSKNITTTAYVNEIARQEKLDLQARMDNPTRYGIHSKIVLVKLNSRDGAAYSHVGSINGSEPSSKINREMAVQVESQNLYAGLMRVFRTDWNLAGPIFIPVIMRNYRAADHVVISEVLYDPYGSTDTGKEWIELYNPTGNPVDISGWSLGDAASDNEYGSGRYLFPGGTILQPGGVIVIAQQAVSVSVTFRPDFEFVVDPVLDDPTVPNMDTVIPTWEGFGLALGNQGDEVILLDAAGRPVDAVVWGAGSYPGTLPYAGEIWSDHSLERLPANRDTDDCAADLHDQYPSTPGSVP